MLTILLGAAGFMVLLLGLTMIAVYCSFVIAHRTDEIVAKMGEDGAFCSNRVARQV